MKYIHNMDLVVTKGYGTAKHIAAIKEYGPCILHRKSFIKKFHKIKEKYYECYKYNS